MPDTMTCPWVKAKHGETWRNLKVAAYPTAARVSVAFENDLVSFAKGLTRLVFFLAEERTFLRKVVA
jgi:hypothetical protein